MVHGLTYCPPTLQSLLLTDHGQTSATFFHGSKISRCLALVGKRHCRWTHLLFSHSLISPRSQICQCLAVIGTHHGKWTKCSFSHCHGPWTDVGDFLSSWVNNRPTSGWHRYMLLSVDSHIHHELLKISSLFWLIHLMMIVLDEVIIFSIDQKSQI